MRRGMARSFAEWVAPITIGSTDLILFILSILSGRILSCTQRGRPLQTWLAEPASPATMGSAMSRVLIIDDDPGIRTLVELLLQTQGLETDQASQGEEGLQKARQHPPDLFLCDLDMPVMDGIETLAEIRRDPLLKPIPFVLITGMASVAQERRMMRGGANGILRKPFSFAALLEIVRAHVDVPKGGQAPA